MILRICGGFVLVIGLLVIIGWQLGLPFLPQLHRLSSPMQRNEALCFVLCAVGLLSSVIHRHAASALCGVAGVGLALATLGQYLFGADLGIDQFGVSLQIDVGTSHLGRMSPISAIAIVGAGLALALTHPRLFVKQRAVTLVLLGAVVSSLGLIALVGHLGGFEAGYGWGRTSRMPVHSALSAMSLGTGVSLYGWFVRIRGEVDVHHLRRSILLYSTFGTVLLVIVSAVLALLPVHQQFRRRGLDHVAQVAQSKAMAIEQYRLRVLESAQLVASRTRARQLLEQYNAGELSDAEYRRETTPILQDAARPLPAVLGLTRLDARGHVAVALGEPIERHLFPARAIRARRADVAGPWRIRDEFFVTACAPIIDARKQVVGTDVLLIHLGPVERHLADVRSLHGAGGVALAPVQLGGVWMLGGPRADGKTWRRAEGRLANSIRDAVNTNPDMIRPKLSDPEPRVIAYAPVHGSNWLVVVDVDPSLLESGVNRDLKSILIGVLLLAMLGAWGMYLLVQPLTKGIIVRAGTLEHRVREATSAMQGELMEYKRLDAALATHAGRLDRANAALRESQKRLSLALGTAQIGTWDWSIEDSRMHWDDRLHRIFGRGPGAFDGTYEAFLAAIHGEDVDRVKQAIDDTLHDDAEFEVDFRAIGTDGETRYISSRATVLRDDQRRAERVLGVCLNVTERLEAQQALEAHAREQDRLNTEMGRSNQELQQFAYVASHDLQEPLRMVASYVQLLERRYKDKLGEEASEFIAFAVDGAKRMQTLINDLLDYSRVSTSGDPFTTVDAEEPLQRALANLEARILDTGAEVICDPMPTVHADAGQLARLFQNIIGNGMKFCREREPRIHVSVREADGEWIFSIRDNGIGIDPQYADKIFVIFQRLHARSDYEGTGIGLAVCKRIVDRHGGRIWFGSTPAEGTNFYFTIPVAGQSNE